MVKFASGIVFLLEMVVVKIWQIMIVKRRWIEPEKKKILQID